MTNIAARDALAAARAAYAAANNILDEAIAETVAIEAMAYKALEAADDATTRAARNVKTAAARLAEAFAADQTP